MGGILQLVCDKCNFIEDIKITSFVANKHISMEVTKKWREIDGMILCEKCVKDWSKSIKKMKKDNKKNFLKDK